MRRRRNNGIFDDGTGQAYYETGMYFLCNMELQDAEYMLMMAASKGHPDALFQLGYQYSEYCNEIEEDGFGYDKEKSEMYYAMGARAGHPFCIEHMKVLGKEY